MRHFFQISDTHLDIYYDSNVTNKLYQGCRNVHSRANNRTLRPEVIGPNLLGHKFRKFGLLPQILCTEKEAHLIIFGGQKMPKFRDGVENIVRRKCCPPKIISADILSDKDLFIIFLHDFSADVNGARFVKLYTLPVVN